MKFLLIVFIYSLQTNGPEPLIASKTFDSQEECTQAKTKLAQDAGEPPEGMNAAMICISAQELLGR